MATHDLPVQDGRTLAPSRPLPAGACDCHVHISDGLGRFPVRRQTHKPVHAPFDLLREMFEATGLQRSVAVQLMAYGDDNEAMLEGVAQSEGRLRAVAEVPPTATEAELQALHGRGVRALRFYLELPRPVAGIDHVEGVGLDGLARLAPVMRELGWAAEISARCDRIVELAPMLQTLGVPIVLEHMAGCSPARRIEEPAVRQMIDLLGSGAFWVKLTICRMSDLHPDYEDFRPLHDAMVARAPDHMLWGSDWPHALMGKNSPNIGHLLDILDRWLAHDDALRRQILSENPARLFDFPAGETRGIVSP